MQLEINGRIEKRGSLSVAEKVLTWFKQLYDYVMVVIQDMQAHPATDLDVVAVPLPPVEHNPFLRMAVLPQFLQILRKYRGSLMTQLAIRLLMLTGVRTGELLGNAHAVRSGSRSMDHSGCVPQAMQDAYQKETQKHHRHPTLYRA